MGTCPSLSAAGFPQQTPGTVTIHEVDTGGRFSILLALVCLDLGAAVSRGMAALRAASRLDSGLGHTGSGVGTGLLHAGETGAPEDLWSGSRATPGGRGMGVPSGHVAAEPLHRAAFQAQRHFPLFSLAVSRTSEFS